MQCILELLHWLKHQQKDILFVWIPGHIGMVGNEQADIVSHRAHCRSDKKMGSYLIEDA